MARDNLLFQLDNQSHQTKKQSTNVYFEDELEKLPEPNWQNKKHKYKRITLAKDNRGNTAAWQINSQEKLFIEIDRNLDGVLNMILDMRTIYIQYLN